MRDRRTAHRREGLEGSLACLRERDKVDVETEKRFPSKRQGNVRSDFECVASLLHRGSPLMPPGAWDTFGVSSRFQAQKAALRWSLFFMVLFDPANSARFTRSVFSADGNFLLYCCIPTTHRSSVFTILFSWSVHSEQKASGRPWPFCWRGSDCM